MILRLDCMEQPIMRLLAILSRGKSRKRLREPLRQEALMRLGLDRRRFRLAPICFERSRNAARVTIPPFHCFIKDGGAAFLIYSLVSVFGNCRFVCKTT